MASVVLDSNDKGATGAEVTLTTETVVSLYVFAKTGADGAYRIVLEASPDDGTTWVEIGPTISHQGIHTCQCVATKARAKVLVPQGETSTVTAFVLAR